MKHRYPRRLLPKHHYSIITEENINGPIKDFFLLRRINHDNNYSTAKEMMKSQFIPSTFKNGISVCLLSVFKKEDIRYITSSCKIAKKYNGKWNDNHFKTIFPKNKYLKYVRSTLSCGYKISDIYDYQADFPSNKVPSKKTGSAPEKSDVIKLKVIHEPTCINFWHFEILLYGKRGGTEETFNFSNKQMERAGNMILDDLADMACECGETKTYFLNKKLYRHT